MSSSNYRKAEAYAAAHARDDQRHLLLDWAQGLAPEYRGCQFRNLQIDEFSKDAVRTARRYARELAEENLSLSGRALQDPRWVGPNLVINGPVGTGKTTLAWAVLFEILESIYRNDHGASVIWDEFHADFFTVTDLEMRFRGLYAGDGIGVRWLPYSSSTNRLSEAFETAITETACVSYLTTRDLLILDDLGVTRPTEASFRMLNAVLNGRYVANRPTIVTTNLPLGQCVDAEMLTQREASRLSSGATRVHLDGMDRRNKRKRKSLQMNLDLGFETPQRSVRAARTGQVLASDGNE